MGNLPFRMCEDSCVPSSYILREPSALPRGLNGKYMDKQIMMPDIYGPANLDFMGTGVYLTDLSSYIPEDACVSSSCSVEEPSTLP